MSGNKQIIDKLQSVRLVTLKWQVLQNSFLQASSFHSQIKNRLIRLIGDSGSSINVRAGCIAASTTQYAEVILNAKCLQCKSKTFHVSAEITECLPGPVLSQPQQQSETLLSELSDNVHVHSSAAPLGPGSCPALRKRSLWRPDRGFYRAFSCGNIISVKVTTHVSVFCWGW